MIRGLCGVLRECAVWGMLGVEPVWCVTFVVLRVFLLVCVVLLD